MDIGDIQNMQQAQQMKQLEEMKKQLLGKILTKEAAERLSRVRTASPELAGQAELYLMQIYQAGKLTERVTDAKMKEILKILSPERRRRITRK